VGEILNKENAQLPRPAGRRSAFLAQGRMAKGKQKYQYGACPFHRRHANILTQFTKYLLFYRPQKYMSAPFDPIVSGVDLLELRTVLMLPIQ
jgi:hypothetical protein